MKRARAYVVLLAIVLTGCLWPPSSYGIETYIPAGGVQKLTATESEITQLATELIVTDAADSWFANLYLKITNGDQHNRQVTLRLYVAGVGSEQTTVTLAPFDTQFIQLVKLYSGVLPVGSNTFQVYLTGAPLTLQPQSFLGLYAPNYVVGAQASVFSGGPCSLIPGDTTYTGVAGCGDVDITGGDVYIRPGNGTGAGGSGSLLFQTAPVEASGDTPDTFANRWEITNEGHLVPWLDVTYNLGSAIKRVNQAHIYEGFFYTDVTLDPGHLFINAGDLYVPAGNIEVDQTALDGDAIIYAPNLIGGKASGTPYATLLAGQDGTGSNVAGGDLQIEAGNGTGSGGSGDILFRTADVAAAGSTANTLEDRWEITAADGVLRPSTDNDTWLGDSTHRTMGVYSTAFIGGLLEHSPADASPSTLSIVGQEAVGTNIGGGDVSIQAGNGTGIGGSGDIVFSTASAGVSGDTVNTPAERWYISSNGDLIPSAQNAYSIGLPTSPYRYVKEIHAYSLYAYTAVNLYQEIFADYPYSGASNGTGAPQTITVRPGGHSSYIKITCYDPDSCDCTLSETNATDGLTVTLVCLNGALGGATCDFSDSAGVSELAGAATLDNYDTLSLVYAADRWVETSRSNN